MSQASLARINGRRRARAEAGAARLALLNAFELVCDGSLVAVPMSAQRLLVLLALHPRPLLRPFVAGTLWPETTEERAHASLRSALWRVHRLGWGLVEAMGPQLRLSPTVEIDLRASEALARRLLDDTDADALTADLSPLFGDLLPGWYEEWVLLEREQFRQLRLRALDVVCERLTREGMLGEALEVALSVLAVEPLRESAHRSIIRIHLADGNPDEAVRQYRLCRRLLGELGVRPSPLIEDLMRAVTAAETLA